MVFLSFRFRAIKDVKDETDKDSNLVKRIIFEEGEIELKVIDTLVGTQLIASAKSYDYPKLVNAPVVQYLSPDYTPKDALKNAEESIRNEISRLNYKFQQETIRREKEIIYQNAIKYDRVRRQRELDVIKSKNTSPSTIQANIYGGIIQIPA